MMYIMMSTYVVMIRDILLLTIFVYPATLSSFIRFFFHILTSFFHASQRRIALHYASANKIVRTIDIESCYVLSSVSDDLRLGLWCIDSGASIHICSDITMFASIDHKCDQLNVAGVSTKKMRTKGKGVVNLIVRDVNTDTEMTITLDDVYYLPEQPHCLISVKILLDQYPGASSPDFRNFTWRFSENAFEIQWANSMYVLKGSSASVDDSNDDSSEDDSDDEMSATVLSAVNVKFSSLYP